MLAASGFEYDGPAKALRIAPRVTPESFRCFFCGPNGWGTLSQTRSVRGKGNTIRVAHGELDIASLSLQTPGSGAMVKVTLAGKPVRARATRNVAGLTVTFSRPVTISAGQQMTVVIA
jgi:hypothetical protein